jgi:hypothetical protein
MTDGVQTYFVADATGVELVRSGAGASTKWYLSYCVSDEDRELRPLDSPENDLGQDLYPWTDTEKVVSRIHDRLAAKYAVEPPTVCETPGEDIVARWDLIARV